MIFWSSFRQTAATSRKGVPKSLTTDVDAGGLLSPSLIAVVLFIFGILCTLIPVDFYQRTVGEKNYMYGNWRMYIYIALCTAAFLISTFLAMRIAKRNRVKTSSWFVRSSKISRFGMNRLIITISLLNLILCSVRLIFMELTIGIGAILSTFSSGGGSQLRDTIIAAIADGKVGWISDVTLGLTVAIWWIASQAVRQKRRLLTVALLNLALFAFTSLLSLSRDILLTAILIVVIVSVSKLNVIGFSNRIRSFLLVLAGVCIFGGIFIFVGGARSSGGQDTFTRQFVGYFPASYNRLAAEIDGKLIYPNSSWGFYSSQWFWDLPVITNVFNLYDVGKTLGLDTPQDSLDNWDQQFTSTQAASLNRSYIWLTAYGFAFADYGWFGFVYFLIYGFLAGFLYIKFKQNTLFGGILFPYLLTTIVKWWSILYLSSRTSVIMLGVAFLVWLTWQVVDVAVRGEGTYNNLTSKSAGYELNQSGYKNE